MSKELELKLQEHRRQFGERLVAHANTFDRSQLLSQSGEILTFSITKDKNGKFVLLGKNSATSPDTE